jgi:hypothetical protein
LRISQDERRLQAQLLADMRHQIVRHQFEVLQKASRQSHCAQQQCKPDLIARPATERNLLPIRLWGSEVSKQFRPRQIRRDGFKADARMPHRRLRDGKRGKLVHPLTIGAYRMIFQK